MVPSRARHRCTTSGCGRPAVTGSSKCVRCAGRVEQQRLLQRGSTTERQLGADHQAERRRQLEALVEGSPCPRCGRPRYRWQRLHLDHYPVPRKFGGTQTVLTHGRCDSAAGGAISRG